MNKSLYYDENPNKENSILLIHAISRMEYKNDNYNIQYY